MEARHDLRKFITELPVAQRCAVLSSGRDAESSIAPVFVKLHYRQIVGRLTPWAGIESPTAMASDQTAAEALQEAETEVGVAVKVGQGPGYRSSIDRPTRRLISALRPES